MTVKREPSVARIAAALEYIQKIARAADVAPEVEARHLAQMFDDSDEIAYRAGRMAGLVEAGDLCNRYAHRMCSALDGRRTPHADAGFHLWEELIKIVASLTPSTAPEPCPGCADPACKLHGAVVLRPAAETKAVCVRCCGRGQLRAYADPHGLTTCYACAGSGEALRPAPEAECTCPFRYFGAFDGWPLPHEYDPVCPIHAKNAG
jgi:hypothetical protein